MRKTIIVLSLTTLISTLSQYSYAGEFDELVSGEKIPLTMQLKDLNNSWRQITISGQFEMGDFVKTWSSIFNPDNNINVYYTQGKTIVIGSETYIIAYRLPPKSEGISFKSILENSFGSNCAESSFPVKLTPQTNLNLSLLNLRTIGSLNDILSFNFQEKISESEKAYQNIQKVCEQAKFESLTAQMQGNLASLGSAVRAYAQENDGVLPNLENAKVAETNLANYVSDRQVFISPITLELFQPNASLSKKKLIDIPNPEQTIIFYENKSAKDGRRGVVFLDGSVDRIDNSDWLNIKQRSGIR